MFSEHLKRTQLQLGNELIKCFVAAELCQFLSFCCTSNYDCTVLSLFDAQTGHKFPPLLFFFCKFLQFLFIILCTCPITPLSVLHPPHSSYVYPPQAALDSSGGLYCLHGCAVNICTAA